MKELKNLEIENQFLIEFDKIWNKGLESYNCSQAQLNGGSRLRPLMVLWGYLATFDDFELADVKYIADVATSIELIHKATILLDDWIDGDEARHGAKAFHIEYDPYYTVILALHMVSDSMIRLKRFLPTDNKLSNSYYNCADIIAETIYSMSKGALEELRLDNNMFNLDHIKRIAQLETAEIIGNALQLGYFAGNGKDLSVSKFFKFIGDRFGYLFQAMNDLEAFSNSSSLVMHKGSLNDDISISRKNIGVAMLYNIAKKSDKELIINGTPETLNALFKKYKIVDFIIKETELFYSNIVKEFSVYAMSENWKHNFIQFMNRMKRIAYLKLGLE